MNYSHRPGPMVPPGAPPNNRLAELMDQIRQEFENQSGRAGEYEQQLTAQVHEMELVRRKIYELEQAQIQIKAKYDEDLARLRHELEARGGPSQSSHLGGPPQSGPSHPPPPSVGHGPSNLFGGIMAGTATQGGPGLAPPPQEPAQSQGLPPHMAQGPPPGLNPPPGPPGPPPQFSGYGAGPSANGYPPQPPQPTASPGPGRGRGARGPPGPATPQQNQAAPYPGSPQIPRPTPPPGQAQNQLALQAQAMPNVGNSLAEIDPDTAPPHLKREGPEIGRAHV